MTAFSMHETNRNEVKMAMHECGLMGESLNVVDETPHESRGKLLEHCNCVDLQLKLVATA